MMNKFHDLMEKGIPIEIIIDTGDDDGNYNSIRGVIKIVGDDYIEIGRAPYQDEKSRYRNDCSHFIYIISRFFSLMAGRLSYKLIGNLELQK